jgi:type IV secretory pathway TrbL component
MPPMTTGTRNQPAERSNDIICSSHWSSAISAASRATIAESKAQLSAIAARAAHLALPGTASSSNSIAMWPRAQRYGHAKKDLPDEGETSDLVDPDE